MLESIIKDKIMVHFDNNHFFMSNTATWFPSYDVMYSCITQLLQAMEHWTKSLGDSNDVDIVYLDFCKVFDGVPHQCVLFKLKAYGISGNVLNWIMDFLSNSRQGVNFNGSCSDQSNNINGVPQGSVLGPLLFIVYK